MPADVHQSGTMDLMGEKPIVKWQIKVKNKRYPHIYKVLLVYYNFIIYEATFRANYHYRTTSYRYLMMVIGSVIPK